MRQVLEGIKESTERTAYILMDKIQPKPLHNYLLRRDSPLELSSCVSELGVFGAYVRYLKINMQLHSLLVCHHISL